MLKPWVDLAALMVALPLASASSRWLDPPIVLYLAIALALVAAARLGRRAIVASGTLARDPAPRGGERSTTGEGRGGAARAPAPAVLEGVTAHIDEVTYAPGDPNVLSMTKFLRDEVRPAASPAPRPRASSPDLADLGEGAAWTRADRGDETVLAVAGVLDAVSAAQLRPALDALVAERRGLITVDLSGLRLIDSAGVALVVGLFKRARGWGGGVRVVGLREQPLSIFRLLKLDSLFEVQ